MKILYLCLASAALAAPATQTDVYARARALFSTTDYDGTLAVYEKTAPAAARDHALVGRAWFLKAEYKKATEALEKAAQLEPENSQWHLWLGRAYGRRAESSSVFLAPRYATKSREHFERAIQLAPANKEALNDLFEYYLQAPGFLGGGEQKARALLDQIGAADPAERYFAEARLAETRKELSTAEAKLRRAAEAAPRQVGRVIDLARMLARQGKHSEAEKAFERAAKIDPKSPQLLFARAQTYVESRRNIDQARILLEQYLKSDLTPDDPPRAEAERLLRLARVE